MIRLYTRLTCDGCRADLPAELPGSAPWARTVARSEHGWRRARDRGGLPRDLCPVCARRAARDEALDRIVMEYGEDEDV